MQIKQIKPDHWYQTKQGIGQCLSVIGRSPPSIKINIVTPQPRGTIFISPKDVQYEIPKGEEPTDDRPMNEGILKKQSNGRWAVVLMNSDRELTSGSVIKVHLGNQWVETSIEHNGKEYYSTTQGVKLCEGLPVRIGDVS